MGMHERRTQGALIAALFVRLRTHCRAAQCLLAAEASFFSSLLRGDVDEDRLTPRLGRVIDAAKAAAAGGGAQAGAGAPRRGEAQQQPPPPRPPPSRPAPPFGPKAGPYWAWMARSIRDCGSAAALAAAGSAGTEPEAAAFAALRGAGRHFAAARRLARRRRAGRSAPARGGEVPGSLGAGDSGGDTGGMSVPSPSAVCPTWCPAKA